MKWKANYDDFKLKYPFGFIVYTQIFQRCRVESGPETGDIMGSDVRD